MSHHPLTNFEIQNYLKNNLNLMMLIQEINYLKQTMGHLQ